MDGGLSHPDEDDEFEVYCVALFNVSKIIHEEAEPSLHSNNVFCLPATALSAGYFSTYVSTDTQKALIIKFRLRTAYQIKI